MRSEISLFQVLQVLSCFRSTLRITLIRQHKKVHWVSIQNQMINFGPSKTFARGNKMDGVCLKMHIRNFALASLLSMIHPRNDFEMEFQILYFEYSKKINYKKHAIPFRLLTYNRWIYLILTNIFFGSLLITKKLQWLIKSKSNF